MRFIARRRINPAFRSAIQAHKHNAETLAILSGFTYGSTFSQVVNSYAIAVTPQVAERLDRVADAVDFPRDHIFLNDDTRQVRS